MITRRAGLKLAAGGALLGCALPSAAQAAEFTRTIRIIVPFAPGGTSDILARIMAPMLSEAVGQSVVVENKTGASGNIGADAVAKAGKDAHTLLLTDLGAIALAPSLFPDLSYSPQRDLTPVGLVMFSPYVLAVNEALPVRTAAELIANAKANPGRLAVANSGIGNANHVTAVAMARDLGIEWKAVPYRGGSAATQAVVSGESKVIINGATVTLPFVTRGQLRGLAVTGTERISAAPDIPTFAEAGLPFGDAGSWQGIMTTAGSPPELVARLNAALADILKRPEMAERIKQQGGRVVGGSPAELDAWLADSIRTWGKVVTDAGIKAEG